MPRAAKTAAAKPAKKAVAAKPEAKEAAAPIDVVIPVSAAKKAKSPKAAATSEKKKAAKTAQPDFTIVLEDKKLEAEIKKVGSFRLQMAPCTFVDLQLRTLAVLQVASQGGEVTLDNLSDAFVATLKGSKDEEGKVIPGKALRQIADEVSNHITETPLHVATLPPPILCCPSSSLTLSSR